MGPAKDELALEALELAQRSVCDRLGERGHRVVAEEIAVEIEADEALQPA